MSTQNPECLVVRPSSQHRSTQALQLSQYSSYTYETTAPLVRARMSHGKQPPSKAFVVWRADSWQTKSWRPTKAIQISAKKSLIHCNMDSDKWEEVSQDRSAWRGGVAEGIESFEANRIREAKTKRARRKDPTVSTTSSKYSCHICGRVCRARIGLQSHLSSNRDHS